MRYLALLLALVLGTVWAQAQSKLGINPAAYNKSKKAFEDARNLQGNSYRYSIKTQSFTGFWTKTTYTVQEGKVIERSYSEGHSMGNKTGFNYTSWQEKGEQLGTNTQRGKPVMTMDDVYKEVGGWLTTSKKKNHPNPTYFFETDANGLIKLAGFNPADCMDDCFKGYIIEDLEWL